MNCTMNDYFTVDDIKKWIDYAIAANPPRGMPGPPGADGSTIFIDNGPPTPMNTPGAKSGDMFVNTSNGDIYKF